MSTQQPAGKPKRAKRRNFTEERARVIQYCKTSIEIYETLNKGDDEQLAGLMKLNTDAIINAYRNVLKQYGEEGK